MACDFDHNDRPLCDFSQSDQDEFDWMRYYGNTPSDGTGPEYDHTSGTGRNDYL